ncbi:MAG: NAD(P)H-dependent oxidoreductase [Lachnospiraceae bacterium]|nr:NAD(P)H-dependent oxidoreductase [Lachnospiraceae bacterium]
MKTLVFSLSLNGEQSITLASMRFVSHTHTDDTFVELVMPKSGILKDEDLAKFKEADLIIVATSLYHFCLSSQSMEALNNVGEYMRQNGLHTPVTTFTTSGMMMDNLPHDYIKIWAERFGLRYIKGEGIYSTDILEEKYRADVYAWYNNVKALVSGKSLKLTKSASVRVVYTDDSEETTSIAKQYVDAFTAVGANVAEIHLRDYNYKHCLGCQFCYTDRKCCIDDDFERLCHDVEAGTDVQLYVGPIENGFYPIQFKRFMDRHVQMGRCPADDETVMLFAWHEGTEYKSGDEELFKIWATSYTSFGGEVLIDVPKGFNEDVIDQTVAAINENVGIYRNFYGNSLRIRFADLAQEIQNVEPLDYKFFAQRGDLKPTPRNMMCRPIHSAQDAKMSVEMKSMPVVKAAQHIDDYPTTIPERRVKMEGKSILEWAQNPPYKDYEVKDSDLSPAAAVQAKMEPGELPPQAIIGRKIGKRMSLLMNTFNTIVFSTIGTLASGHFTWKGWLLGAIIGWITGHLITSFIPPNEVQDKFIKKRKIDPNSVKGRILASVITSIIIFPIMSLVMSISMPTLAMNGIKSNIAKMESEVVELYEQQSELKGQQGELIAQRDELKGQQTELKAEQKALQNSMDKVIENAAYEATAERQASLDKLNESIAELETRQADLEAQLEEATPDKKGPLTGQLEGVKGELEGKKAAAKELEASIEGTKAEISASIMNGTPEEPGMQKGIEEMQAGIDDMQKGIDEMQGGIDEMQKGIDGMQEGINGKSGGIEAQKGAIQGMKMGLKRSLPFSIIGMTLIGIILGYFTQPFFLKLVMRSVLGKEEK